MAVLAEGLAEIVPPEDIAELATAERDEHGHLRLDEISFGDVCKTRVRQRLAELGVKATIVSKNIGYEVRCADPIPFDMEYTRDLGYCAAKYVIEGGTERARLDAAGPLQARSLRRASWTRETGRMRVRMVDIDSDRYRIAYAYMLRLKRDDFDDPRELAKLAARWPTRRRQRLPRAVRAPGRARRRHSIAPAGLSTS